MRMNRGGRAAVLAGAIAGLSAVTAAGAQPDATKPVVAGEKPAVRAWNAQTTVDGTKYAVNFQFKPGVPDAGQLTELTFVAASVPRTPDPLYGNRVPLEGAEFVVELKNPAGQVLARYLAHPMPLSHGKFGLHMTPPGPGIHTVVLRGTYRGAKIEAEAKLPVEVWPLPAELSGTGSDGDGGSRRPVITR